MKIVSVKKINIFLILILLFAVSSCEKNLFKSKKRVLDDRLIYTNDPLTIPPILSDSIGKKSSFNAMEIVFQKKYKDGSAPSSVDVSSSDAKFLELAGANKDIAEVRIKIDQESFNLIKKEDTFIHKILLQNYTESVDKPLEEYKRLNMK